jgi:hypothetical protein
MIKEKETQIIEQEYLLELQKIKTTIRQSQNKAMIIVNSAMIMTYYEIGKIINERKVWGNKYVERLSNDLKAYGMGYSATNLKYMMRFAKEFTINEISQHAADQIPWFTLIKISISKYKFIEELPEYLRKRLN